MTRSSTAKGRAVSDVPSRQFGNSVSAGKRTAEQDRRLPHHALAVEIPTDGYALVVQWKRALGATDVVLDDDAGGLSISPSPVRELFGAIDLVGSGNHKVYSNTSRLRIVSLALDGLRKTGENNPLYRSTGDFSKPVDGGKILRLVVSTRAGSTAQWIPLFAIPEVPARGVIPKMFTGATFSGGLLSFPYALDGQIQLGLYQNDTPEEFSAVPMQLTGVRATVEILPEDLTLSDPSGGVIWSFPGMYPTGAPEATLSARVPIELALKKDLPDALDAGRDLRVELMLTGGKDGQAVFLEFPQPRGLLVRRQKGLLHCDLQGDPVQLPLAQALDTETPTSVTGGFSLRYLGLRLLPELSDPIPSPGEKIEGSVVRDAPLLRRFPPAGLVGLSIGRLGLVGRAPEECEIEAQLVRMNGELPGSPLGLPGRILLGASESVTTIWIDMPVVEPTDEPLAVTLRAIRGRFFWATADGGHHRVRVVVRDADPGGRPLRLGEMELLRVDTASIDMAEQIFPASQFHSTIPTFSSDLFLGVDISDLTIGYRRP